MARQYIASGACVIIGAERRGIESGASREPPEMKKFISRNHRRVEQMAAVAHQQRGFARAAGSSIAACLSG